MAVRGSPARVSLAVLAVGLAATGVAAYALHRTVETADQTRFHNAVASVRDDIQRRIDTYVSMLLGARGLFATVPDVTIDRFREYVANLEVARRFPGMQGLAFAKRVPAAERAAFEATMRVLHPDFRVWPEGARDEYYAIVYLEPLDRRNRAAIGFDLFQQPVRRAAMESARDTGTPTASGPVTLVQEIDDRKQAGFVIYIPIYRGGRTPETVEARRRQLAGFVCSPFRVGDLLAGIFGTEPERAIAYHVFDRHEPARDAALYVSAGDGTGRGPRLRKTVAVSVAGRTWDVICEARPAFFELSSRHLVWPLATGGVLVSVALALIAGSQARARRRAELSDRTARAEREHLHRLFSDAPAAIAILRGPDMRYELSNPLNRELARGRDLVGKTVREALPELEAQGLVPVLEQVYRTGQPFVGKEVPVRIGADGDANERYLNGTYQPMRAADGTVEGVMAFAYDVTEQVKARKDMEALANDLRKALRTRDDFLSVAGHELKTPLAALQLHIESLARQAARDGSGEIPPAFRDRLQKATAHVQRMGGLIEELLDVSRISAGRLAFQLERVDLAAMAREVADRFSEQAARAGSALTVRADSPVVGTWDRPRIDQVLSNLLSNAVKYGGGNPIELAVDRTAHLGRVIVTDRGIGIAPEDRDRIFGRFERAVSARNYGGLGLGLWISRQIVEGLGGRIFFESPEAGGTRFVVELPFDATMTIDPAAGPSSAAVPS